MLNSRVMSATLTQIKALVALSNLGDDFNSAQCEYLFGRATFQTLRGKEFIEPIGPVRIGRLGNLYRVTELGRDVLHEVERTASDIVETLDC